MRRPRLSETESRVKNFQESYYHSEMTVIELVCLFRNYYEAHAFVVCNDYYSVCVYVMCLKYTIIIFDPG